jgi:hypothetical protein
MQGIVGLGQGSVWRFLLWIALAVLFHKSSIIFILMALLAETKRRVFTFVWLVYAYTAFAWLPYQFYPWVWLWQ